MRKPAQPRLFFASLPPLAWRKHALARLDQLGITGKLGSQLFHPGNWHQSLSERIFDPTKDECDALLRVGNEISAHACTLDFNRVEGPDLASGRRHCSLRAKGTPKGFSRLLLQVQNRLTANDFGRIATGVTPHITLSYNADHSFDNTLVDPIISWTIDELFLVMGGGDPYGYEVIGRWSLLAEIDPPVTQPPLF